MRHEHKVKIDPFKLHNMENILNKVCVEKKEVGIQVEVIGQYDRIFNKISTKE